MQYIDPDFYSGTYGGTAIDAAQFANYANPAERTIDLMTQNRLSGMDFSKLHDRQQWLIKMAISAQIEYSFQNQSTSETDYAGNGTVQSASIGGFNYSLANQSVADLPQNGEQNIAQRFSKTAYQYLLRSGLMYAGLGVVE
ncbi:MAG: hypothetical protein ACE3JK_14535 [Sporolactobacillus sp.]